MHYGVCTVYYGVCTVYYGVCTVFYGVCTVYYGVLRCFTVLYGAGSVRRSVRRTVSVRCRNRTRRTVRPPLVSFRFGAHCALPLFRFLFRSKQRAMFLFMFLCRPIEVTATGYIMVGFRYIHRFSY